jgi:lipid-A-disaccharide synthase
VHFVSPSIWAWRPERIHRIKQAVSHMLVVFPFEAQIYRDAGIPVSYVGHPLADVIPLEPDTAAARAELGLASGPVIALLPGSRLSEVARHARLMLDAAVRIRRQHADAQFVLPAASEAAARLIRQASQGLDLPLHILAGQSHIALAACDVALVASGTATLEAALFKKPMVITYRVPALTAYLMRKKALQPWIGLPNILARDFVVPERVQEAATPENLANDALAWLDDAPRREAAVETFRAMHLSLRQNASARIAEALDPYLEGA